jgi:hypothetical protein
VLPFVEIVVSWPGTPRRVSVETVRLQLKDILSKTGSGRQH